MFQESSTLNLTWETPGLVSHRLYRSKRELQSSPCGLDNKNVVKKLISYLLFVQRGEGGVEVLQY